MASFFEGIPDHVVVVLDESYCDFVADIECTENIQHLNGGRNVVLVRSFSKGCGLAGLRVGYGISHPELVEYLNRAALPFHCGGPVLRAAIAALDDYQFRRKSRELVIREREFLFADLSMMGLNCLPSQANFLLVLEPPRDVSAITDALLERGVIVRPMEAFGMPNAFRVSVGLHEQNVRFLSALREALDGSIADPVCEMLAIGR